MNDNLTVVEDPACRATSPLVSVCIVTYNQEAYIGEALDSVLKQDVSFPYEIIVGDDGSDDDTARLLRAYQQQHPERIRLNLHETNNGGIPARDNMVTNLRSARGTYVALLDGDDYWISDNKLQRQTTFLEDHPKVSFSFHDGLKMVEDDTRGGAEAPRRFSSTCPGAFGKNRFFSNEELVSGLCPWKPFSIPAASVMFRRHLFDPIPAWFDQVWNADKAMQLHFANFGPAYYHDDLLSFYRQNNPSSMKHRYADSFVRNNHHLHQIPVFTQVNGRYAQNEDIEYYARFRTRTRLFLQQGSLPSALVCMLRSIYHFARASMRSLSKTDPIPC